MNSKLTAVLCGLLMVSAGGTALAVCAHGADGTDYCGPELIQQLYVTKTGAVYVRPTTNLSPRPSGFSCSPISGLYFLLDPGAQNFKQLYAALLTARLSGAPVTIVTDPTQSQCTISYVTL